MTRYTALALLLGCGGNEVLVDAAISADACVQGEPHDVFVDPTPCAPWGTLQGDPAKVGQSGGTLSFGVLGPNSGMPARCVANLPLPLSSQGMVVHAMGGAAHGGTAWFRISHNATTIAIMSHDGIVSLGNETQNFQFDRPVGGMMVADGSYWWRLRQATSNTLVGEISIDRLTWTELGGVSGSITETTEFDMGASVYQSSPSIQMTFSQLNPCM